MTAEGVNPADLTSVVSDRNMGLSLLAERVQDAVVIAEAATGRIRNWNPAAETLFGYSAAEAQALTVDLLVPARYRSRFQAELDSFADDHRRNVEHHRVIDSAVQTKSGEERPVELTLASVHEFSPPGDCILLIASAVIGRDRSAGETAARGAGDAELQRLAVLAESTALLVSSLDYRATLAEVVRLIVPTWADGCTVSLVNESGVIQILATASVSAERDVVVRELRRRYPIRLDAAAGAGFVLRTGQSQLYGDDIDALWRAIADDHEHLDLLRRLGTTSRMIVPMRSRGHTLGLLSFSLTSAERRYGPADLALAEELARRAALAIDNTRLYESLSLSEHRYRSFVQQSSDVIAVVGSDGLLRYASPSIEKVLGYPPESIVGVRSASLVHPDDSGWVWEMARNLIQDPGLSHRFEVRLRHADGSWRTVEVSVTNLFSEPAVQGVVLNLHDITDRKRSEEDERFLSDAGALLATSLDYDTTVNQLLDLAVPRLGDWCVIDVIDDDGWIRRAAVACRDPAIARALEAIPQLAPIGRFSSHPVAVALRTGTPVVIDEFSKNLQRIARSLEHFVLLRAIRTGSLISVPLVARDQRLGVISFGYLESGRRHDERDRSVAQRFADRATLAIKSANLYHEAQAALTEVQRALNLRDEFLSVASHELRTPLTALKGQIQLAERRLQRGQHDAVPTLIHHADAQIDRLTRLVRDLLDVSRIGGGGITMEFQPVALGALVQHVVDLERESASGRTIVLDLPAATPTIEADPQRIEQVLFNLVQNARKYSAPDTEMRVTVRVVEDAVTIAVTDRGDGIPAEDLARIFERFHRAENVDHNIAGLGLGLYIAREIVEAHGGSLSVESAVGRGSTFTVALPWSAELE